MIDTYEYYIHDSSWVAVEDRDEETGKMVKMVVFSQAHDLGVHNPIIVKPEDVNHLKLSYVGYDQPYSSNRGRYNFRRRIVSQIIPSGAFIILNDYTDENRDINGFDIAFVAL